MLEARGCEVVVESVSWKLMMVYSGGEQRALYTCHPGLQRKSVVVRLDICNSSAIEFVYSFGSAMVSRPNIESPRAETART